MTREHKRIIRLYGFLVDMPYQEAVDLGRTAEWWRNLATNIIHAVDDKWDGLPCQSVVGDSLSFYHMLQEYKAGAVIK